MYSHSCTHTDTYVYIHPYIHTYIHTNIIIDCLKGLIDVIGNSNLDLKNNNNNNNDNNNDDGTPPLYNNNENNNDNSAAGSSLYLDCLLKLGQWKLAILDPCVQSVDMDTRRSVLALYSKVIAIYICIYIHMYVFI